MPLITRSKERPDYPLPTRDQLGGFWYSRLKDEQYWRGGVFVLVRPPMVRKVWLWSKGNRAVKGSFRIQIPWHYLAARLRFQRGACLSDAFLGFLKRDPEGDPDPARYGVPLPNSWQDGRICFGSSRPWYRSRVDSYMDRLYRIFWSTGFTTDIAPNSDYLPSPLFTDSLLELNRHEYTWEVMRRWAAATQEGTNLAWKPTGGPGLKSWAEKV